MFIKAIRFARRRAFGALIACTAASRSAKNKSVTNYESGQRKTHLLDGRSTDALLPSGTASEMLSKTAGRPQLSSEVDVKGLLLKNRSMFSL